MNRTSRFLRFLLHGGLTDQETKMCIPDIRKRNYGTLGWIVPFMGLVLLCLFIVSLIPGTGEEPNRILYGVYVGIMVVLYVLVKTVIRKNLKYVIIPAYIFTLSVYAFGIAEATLLDAASLSSTMFCVFLVAIPLLFIDSPLRLTIQTIIAEIALLITYFLVGKAKMTNSFIIIESVGCTLLGIVYGYIIQKTKFSDIRNHLMVEIQRDTDILTGACSRVAYIRDIGMMGGSGSTVGFVYCDVNGLKKTNDNFGHDAGDILIKDAFSLMLKYFSTDHDRVYRVGGDEFVIISVGEDESVFNNRFKSLTNDENSHILSCGSSWFNNISNVENALKDAEQRMYEAKEHFYKTHPEENRRVN